MLFQQRFSGWVERALLNPAAPRRATSRRPYVWAALLALLLVGVPALLRPLQVSDEGRYAEVSREVLTQGNWLIPTLNGVPHLTKPPLYYDLVALGFAAFGANPFTARLVSLLTFLLGLLIMMRWAEAHGGRRAAPLCAVIALTMLHPIGAGQFGDLNMLLTFFMTAGLLCLFDGLSSPHRRAAWLLAWLFFGLAFMTKGPPALMIVAGTLLTYRWVSGKPLGKPAAWWFGGVALFCLVALPWYLWLLAAQGKMLWAFWWEDVFRRTGLAKSTKPLYYFFYYLPVFLAFSTGWGAFMAWRFYLAARWRRAAGGGSWWRGALRSIRALPADQQWLLAWLIFTLAIFSVLRSHMVTYIQPAYPAAALLLTLYLLRQRPRPALIRAFSRMACFAFVVTLIGVWGLTLLSFALVRMQSSKGYPRNEDVTCNVLARKMVDNPTRNWTLVQCFEYHPSFDFTTRRRSHLCKVEIHPGWPVPAELSETSETLRQRVRQNMPLMVLIKKNKIKRVFPEPLAPLRELARGGDLVLLSNVP